MNLVLPDDRLPVIFRSLAKLVLLIGFCTHICFGQTISNPSFEGQPAQSIPPPGWYSCNTYSTPDTQPGTWMVDQTASDGSTYISLVTRGRNSDHNDGFTEAIGTRLSGSLMPQTCYTFSLDLSYFARFDDGLMHRQGTWRPVKLNVWASNQECSKTLLLWKSAVITNEEWQTYSFNFTVDQPYNILILEADYAETTIHNGNVIVDNLKISKEQLNINDAILCKGETAKFQVDFPDASIEWSTGSTAAGIEVNSTGTYWVKVGSQTCTVADTFIVSYPEPLKVNLGRDVTICTGDSVVFDVSVSNGIYEWNTGSTANKITVKEPGIYRVRVSNGCEYMEEEIKVSVVEECCLITAPNVFTPNHDSFNDVFEISSRSIIGKYHLRIYNRWGLLVYEAQDLNRSWNGFTFDGKEAATGVYYWTVNMLCIRSNRISENSFKGTVTLLR